MFGYVQRITLPLPTGPKHVHCYVAEGTLFDTGLGLGEVEWPSVERIAITHMHPDHVGGAAAATGATGARVHQGGQHDPALLYEGSGLDGWQVVELPGHADGHLGFLRDGVLIAGDTCSGRSRP